MVSSHGRDGGIDWLDRPRPRGNYGMDRFYRSIDTVVMGRDDGAPAKALSSSREVLRGPAIACGRPPEKDVWLVGGGALIGDFLDARQIDEFIIHVVPVLIGEGIPLLKPKHRTVPLTLVGSRSFSDGVVRLHYAVRR